MPSRSLFGSGPATMELLVNQESLLLVYQSKFTLINRVVYKKIEGVHKIRLLHSEAAQIIVNYLNDIKRRGGVNQKAERIVI